MAQKKSGDLKGARQVTAERMTSAFPMGLRAIARTAAVMAALALPFGMAPMAAAAQEGSLFEPVLRINGSVITRYELDQRILFLKLLRSPGDPEREAMRGLTQDRLASAEAKRFGLKLTREQMAAGMDEFAGRANLTADQLVEALGQAGVQVETFRDFVGNGLIWRELVRGRFLPTTSVSEAEIDRAIANGTKSTAMQLLMSEIILPVQGDPEPQLELARTLRDSIKSEGDFAAAARRHSASPSAGRGGRLDWTPTANLPPAIVQLVLASGADRITEPVSLPNAIAIFQLRDVMEDVSAEGPLVEVEYAEFLLPNTPTVQADAAALAARVDTCKDLYEEARGLPEDRLTVTTKTVPELPGDVGMILAQLDAGEYSLGLSRGNTRVFLMLCSRAPKGEGPIDRNAVREQLISQKLTALSEVYLEELRSEAIIEQP